MFREKTFRYNPIVLAATMIAAVFLITRLITGLQYHRLIVSFGWQTDALMILALLAFCALLRWLCVVHVGPDGLRTTDGVGRYHSVRWNELRRVTNVLGFLWIPHGSLGTALLFPIFLDRSAEFREYVLTHAPEDNPLRAYLAAR